MNILKTDFCIIGGGIMGTSVARDLAKILPSASITLIESESSLFQHNSSRNSGVLHSGIYYKPGSLKAQLCARGNKLLREFIQQKKLWLHDCGKIVVPKTETEAQVVKNLYEQGRKNGASVELLNGQEALSLEPFIQSPSSSSNFPYLYSPDTAVCSLNEVIEAMKEEIACKENIEVVKGETFLHKINSSGLDKRQSFKTASGKTVNTKWLINCTGYDSLRVAQQYGVGLDKQMVFLKGYYLTTPLKKLKNHGMGCVPQKLLYPVPPIAGSIFLGVHTTTTKDYFKLGPSAFPALSGTHYEKFSKISFKDLLSTSSLYSKILLSEKRDFYLSQFQAEFQKIVRKEKAWNEGAKICKLNVPSEDFNWDRSGIRTQLISTQNYSFDPDFHIEKKDNSIHLLNFASPGWTCALSASEYICKELIC